MHLFQLVVLALVQPLGPSAQPPRACRGNVVVQADTTVARLDAATESLLQWTLSSGGPEYPAELRSARQEGEVMARFVVDTTGRVVIGTATIITESHRGFGQSVCQFLARARFQPVPVGGRKRSVAVTAAPFRFSLGQ